MRVVTFGQWIGSQDSCGGVWVTLEAAAEMSNDYYKWSLSPGQVALQSVHDAHALAVVAHLRLHERVQVAQMPRLGRADALEQQLRDFCLAIKVRLGHSQVTLRLEGRDRGRLDRWQA